MTLKRWLVAPLGEKKNIYIYVYKLTQVFLICKDVATTLFFYYYYFFYRTYFGEEMCVWMLGGRGDRRE